MHKAHASADAADATVGASSWEQPSPTRGRQRFVAPLNNDNIAILPCGTPGCELHAWHSGECTSQRVSGARKRRPPVAIGETLASPGGSRLQQTASLPSSERGCGIQVKVHTPEAVDCAPAQASGHAGRERERGNGSLSTPQIDSLANDERARVGLSSGDEARREQDPKAPRVQAPRVQAPSVQRIPSAAENEEARRGQPHGAAAAGGDRRRSHRQQQEVAATGSHRQQSEGAAAAATSAILTPTLAPTAATAEAAASAAAERDAAVAGLRARGPSVTDRRRLEEEAAAAVAAAARAEAARARKARKAEQAEVPGAPRGLLEKLMARARAWKNGARDVSAERCELTRPAFRSSVKL